MPVAEDLPPHEQYVVDVLLNCAPGGSTSKDRAPTTPTPAGILPCPAGQKGDPQVVPVLLSTVESLSHLRVHLPNDIRSSQARETVWKTIQEVHRRFPDGIPLLDPIQNMQITDEKFKALVQVIEYTTLHLWWEV